MTPDDLDLYGHDAVYVPVPAEMLVDAGMCLWLAPDPNPMPEIICSDTLDLVLYGWDRLRMWWHETRVRFVERIALLLRVGAEFDPSTPHDQEQPA